MFDSDSLAVASPSRHWLTLRLEVDTQALREAWGQGGLLRRCLRLMVDLLLCVGCCSLQAVLPEAYPELPWFPAIGCIVYLAARRPAGYAYFFAVLGGMLLDAAGWGGLGISSLSFLLVAALVQWLQGYGCRGSYIGSVVVSGVLGAWAWLGIRLWVFSWSASVPVALRLVPQWMLCGGILTGAVFTPLWFALLDLAEWRASPAREE